MEISTVQPTLTLGPREYVCIALIVIWKTSNLKDVLSMPELYILL